jgi:hypothetical protein
MELNKRLKIPEEVKEVSVMEYLAALRTIDGHLVKERSLFKRAEMMRP